MRDQPHHARRHGRWGIASLGAALGVALGAAHAAPPPMQAGPGFASSASSATLPEQTAAVPDDVHPFLTRIDGAEAMSWVRAENARSLKVLQSDPHYQGFYDQALAIGQSHDRLAMPMPLAGAIYNFWRDKDHVRGILRRTTPADFRTASPQWHTVLDLDALARSEGANWVYKGIDCDEPAETHCLISLSDGGEDATTEREFDLAHERFVEGGFTLPHSKQSVAWVDDDTLLVARDWGGDTLTASGYPFVAKLLHRGASLARAREIYRAGPTQIEVDPVQFADGQGHRVNIIITELATFHSAFHLLTPHGLTRLALPEQTDLEGLLDNRLIAHLNESWTPKGASAIPAGALVALDLAHPDAAPSVIFAPGPRQSIEDVAVTKSRIAASVYDNVRGSGMVFTPHGTGWTAQRLDLPQNVAVNVTAADLHSDAFFLTVAGFLTPTELWHADAATAAVAKIRALPAQFDATGLSVDQFEAKSSDGTAIPYFVVHRSDMKTDGANPTMLYAYGGFGVSMLPRYSGVLGRLWLDHGGVYVLANIRGGGEFGPAWHDAGLKTHRQLIYDDFAAVARDLATRGIADAAHLGIRGGSNGGLLMGVEFTQHPELWSAVIIEVPLLDMMNFETMSAGASWVGEYGSVSIPAQRDFLRSISPLQNLRVDAHYPEPFIFTTTKDDRVGPVHARRFAARMQAMGLPFLYYEETEGGHAAGANQREVAEEEALEFTYLTRKLMAPGTTATHTP